MFRAAPHQRERLFTFISVHHIVTSSRKTSRFGARWPATATLSRKAARFGARRLRPSLAQTCFAATSVVHYWGAAPTPAALACYQHIPARTASASGCSRQFVLLRRTRIQSVPPLFTSEGGSVAFKIVCCRRQRAATSMAAANLGGSVIPALSAKVRCAYPLYRYFQGL